jgi:alpha-L-arabinofuranosidase
MRRKNTYWVLACLALFSLVLVSQRGRNRKSAGPMPPSTVANLLTNPDFQNAANGLPESWVLDPKLAARGRVQIEDLTPGSRALKLAPNEQNTDKDRPFSVGQLISATQLRGTRLSVRTSMRTEEGAAGFTLVFALAKGKPVGSAVFTQTDSSSKFVEQEGSLDVDTDVDQIIFSCSTNSSRGGVWFKDLYLGGGGSATAGAGSATTEGSGSRERKPSEYTASAVIDAGKILRAIPKELFGTNIEWVRNGNGVWNPETKAPQPQMARMARDLGVTVVRYPGGGFADYYHWQQGVGNTRPTVKDVLDSGSSPIWFGTNELMTFCRSVGAVPMLSVNVVTGNAAEAADWVAYCNRSDHAQRAQDGSAAPYGVKYWEIGNEQYIKSASTVGINAPMDAYLPTDAYLQKFKSYAAAMKQVDPTIRVGAIGGLNFGRYALMHDNTWTRAVLQQAGSQIDFLAVHNSYAPLVVVEPQPPSFTDTYQAMLAFPSEVEQNLHDLDQQIRTYAPADAERIAIAVTEWGPLFAFLPDNPWVDHCKTLGSALYVASMMQVFLRAPRLQIATFFKLTDDSFAGWLTANGEPKPSYYALQMFSRHFGEQLVSASINGPTFHSKAVGMVAAAADVPYLDIVASLSSDGSKLYVIAVNRSMDGAVKTRLQFRGFRPAQAGSAWVLTAPGLDANNGRDVLGNGWAKQMEAEKSPLFSRGAAGTVAPQQQAVSNVTDDFSYAFPSGSVTALQFSKVN